MNTIIKEISIREIRLDGGTQPRAAINEAVVGEYADAIAAGAAFPLPTVFFDGAEYWLADGFHRLHAHRKLGNEGIRIEQRDGTRRDAVLYSVGSNGAHGLRRTNEDKRKAVSTLLADAEWAAWSDRKIAEACDVTHPFVASVRASLVTVTSEKPAERTYTTKHGTEAAMNTARIAAANSARPAHVQAAKNQLPEPAAVPPIAPVAAPAPADEHAGYEVSEEEIAEAQAYQAEVMALFTRAMESDDPLGVALKENAQLRAENESLRSRLFGLMNEKNEAVRLAKAMRSRLEAIERNAA